MADRANIELLKRYSKEINIADSLDTDLLDKIGEDVVKSSKTDDLTRSEWFDKYNEALKIAKQTMEIKSYPFEGSANIKIPLILIGCIQFNARILPEIIQMGKSVNVEVIGRTTQELEQRAKRLSDHMSLQTVGQNWNEDTDRMLMVLPLVGTVFRKWNYDAIDRQARSYLCLPTEIIVDNSVSSLSSARRITHVLQMSKNEIIEKQRFGLYRDVNLFEVKDDYYNESNPSDDQQKVLPSDLEDTSDNYIVYEQCSYLDLDKDGYEEPYTITVLKYNHQVLRISARYDEKSFVLNSRGELVKIIPFEYYTNHTFLQSPDGTFLGVGLGQLLLQLNSAANTITNNLIDAATLSNLRGGFLSSNLRVPKGRMDLVPGKYTEVNLLPGQRLTDSIYEWPIREPSQTLMALLNFLVDFGKQVANVNDILMGSPEAANMPATSVVALVEQGSKIYSSILNRLYESLRKEFNVLYGINKRYFSLYQRKDIYTKSGFVTEDDYMAEDFNILPIANPALGTDAVRLAKMQVLLQMAQDPMLDKKEIYTRYFEILGISDADKLFAPPPQPAPPSPDDILKLSQADYVKMQTSEILMEKELKALELMVKEKEAQADAAYKGGQLAIQQISGISDMAKTEAVTSSQDVAKASNLVNTYTQQTSLGVDYSDVLQQTASEVSQNNLPQGQQMGYNQAPTGNMQPQAPIGGSPNKGGVQLPPELDQALKSVSQEQNAPTSPQGIIQAGQIK